MTESKSNRVKHVTDMKTNLLLPHSLTPSLRHLPRPRRRRGLGLVELLVSLAIVASLLTAVAVATKSSFQAYAINQEFSLLTQKTRMAMHRILSDIRTSDAHAVDADPNSAANIAWCNGSAETPLLANSVSMYDPSNTLHVYRWDSTTKQLLADVLPHGATTMRTHVLLEGVEKFEVTHVPMQSFNSRRTAGTRDLLRRATILLTVRSSGSADEMGDGGVQQTVTLSSSVVPRRNFW